MINNNIIITPQKNKDPLKINKQKIKKIFKEYGIVIIRGYLFNEKLFHKFASSFTKRFSVETNRRKKTKIDQINYVDPGFQKMSLHSEASFSPTWPEVIWFYGKEVSKKFGETTICDGNQLWNLLNYKTKEFLKSNLLEFSVKSDLKTKFKNKDWDLNRVGIYDSFIDEDGYLNYKHIKFAIHKNKYNDKIYLSSHILYKDTDPTIKYMKLLGGKKIPSKMLDEIRLKSEEILYYHKWKKKDLIMLDNKKFMHGRNKVVKNDNRKILNIQTLVSNI